MAVPELAQYSGKDIRIEAGPTVSVCVRKGWLRKSEEWRQVDVRDMEIDVRFDGDCRSPFGVHSIQDLGIDQRQLSHVLGR